MVAKKIMVFAQLPTSTDGRTRREPCARPMWREDEGRQTCFSDPEARRRRKSDPVIFTIDDDRSFALGIDSPKGHARHVPALVD